MDFLTVVFVAVIVVLFFAELFFIFGKKFIWKQHSSIKNIISTVGVLGTFVGIVIGLWNFDYTNINKSLPNLLGGLTTAFVTSVAGMGAFIILSFFEKLKKPKETSKTESATDILKDVLSELQTMNSRIENLENTLSNQSQDFSKLEKLDQLDKLEEMNKNLSDISQNSNQDFSKLDKLDKLDQLDLLKQIGKINKAVYENISDIKKSNNEVSTKLEELNKLDNLDNIETAISNLEKNQNSQNQTLIESFGKNFEEMNQVLKATFDKISEGASKEIISALEGVIKDFNTNLTEQFGENFKALNSSVLNMIKWQENYKSSIEVMEQNLKTVSESMQKSETSITNIASRNDEVRETYNQLKTIIETYQNQTEELNRHLETFGNLSDKAGELFPKMNENIENLTQKIADENVKQIADISDKFEKVTQKSSESLDIFENSQNAISNNLKTLISDIETSITQNGEKLTNTINQISTTFEENKNQTNESLKTQTNEIVQALQKQSDVIIKISEKIPNELANFENTFENLTVTFMKNYKQFLTQIEAMTTKS